MMVEKLLPLYPRCFDVKLVFKFIGMLLPFSPSVNPNSYCSGCFGARRTKVGFLGRQEIPVVVHGFYDILVAMSQSAAIAIEDIVETIRKRILNGEYSPGVKLSENTLAKEFSCSRTPVREAIKRLEQDNLVVVQPFSGSYVKQLTDEENLELTEIRASLESLAFRLACDRRADAEPLKQLLIQMGDILESDTPDFVLYGQTHYRFHMTLIEMSGSEMLIDMYKRMNLNTASKLFYHRMSRPEAVVTQHEHEAIVTALALGDTEAGQQFMFNHLWKKRERLLHQLEKTAGDE